MRAATVVGSEKTPLGCIGSLSLGRFRVSVYRPDQGGELPIKEVASIPAGAKLVWDPVHLSSHFSHKSEIAVLVVSRTPGSLIALTPRKASAHAEWDLPPAAIVMLENIVRHMEHGERPLVAALNGSREIGFTIVSVTLSLTAMFILVLFMGGILGRLFREFSVTICVAILISGFVSVTLTPMLCSRLLRPPRTEA